MMNRLRLWLICLIARGDCVAVNLVLGRRGAAVYVPVERRLLTSGCLIDVQGGVQAGFHFETRSSALFQ